MADLLAWLLADWKALDLVLTMESWMESMMGVRWVGNLECKMVNRMVDQMVDSMVEMSD